MTSTERETRLDQSLDFTPICQHGHPGELNGTLGKPCQNPAEFFSRYHTCPEGIGAAGPGEIMWCSKHLADTTLHIMKQLNTPGRGLQCKFCKTLLPELKDWIWGTTPIG